MVGLSVYNDKNESLGSINDLLTDKNGKITAVVIGVGGFLGVGEHLVAIPFEKVKFTTEPIVYTSTSSAPNARLRRPGDHHHGRARLRRARESPIRGIRITPCSTRPRKS